MKKDCLKQYLLDLNQQYKTGVAREHAYRPALKVLMQNLLPKMVVTNEPSHIDCGAPDYIVSREKDHLPVFFIEAKDLNDADLDGKSKSGHKEQFDRYKQALDHIIFTDYLDFHLIVTVVTDSHWDSDSHWDDSHWDRYLGMTAAMTQVPVPTANDSGTCPHGYWDVDVEACSPVCTVCSFNGV